MLNEINDFDCRLNLQADVRRWTVECFGGAVAADKEERNHRFLEEALELVQAAGCTKSEAIQLVDYVYNRPAGELAQEVGGALVTLAALCNAHDIDLLDASEVELKRCYTKIEKIRAKQKAKPKIGPLPEAVPAASAWLPMSTAPRNGTDVLLKTAAGIVSAYASLERDSGDEYGYGACDYHEWVAFDGKFTIDDDEPLGWQPLP